MNFEETVRDALDSLSARKLRAGLSMLGMIFGVGAVIAMLSIGEGAERQALESIERLGLRNILVQSKQIAREDLEEIRKKSPGLSPRDMDAILEAIPGVERVEPRVRVDPYKILSRDGKADADVLGVSHRHDEWAHLALAEGRFLDKLDEETHAQVAVIGANVRRDLFGYRPAVGSQLKVNDVWLEVVGVLRPEGEGASNVDAATLRSTTLEIYLPYTTALRKFEHDALDPPLD